MQGKTIVTIAHLLATTENADQILVIDDGQLSQVGTHKELMKKPGIYRNFIQIRERAEGWHIALEVSNMVNILVIDSRAEEGLLYEVIDFLSARTHCQITHVLSPSDVGIHTDILSFPGLDIHIQEQAVYCDGEQVAMSHHEFFTLLYLAQHPGWVFSKAQIYETVWKRSGDGRAAVVNVISQIRRKIGDKYIRTVVGSGYKFEA